MDSLSVLAYRMWWIRWEIEFDVCKYKDKDIWMQKIIFSFSQEWIFYSI